MGQRCFHSEVWTGMDHACAGCCGVCHSALLPYKRLEKHSAAQETTAGREQEQPVTGKAGAGLYLSPSKP